MAVELSKQKDNLKGLASELDIKVDILYRWRREAARGDGSAFPGKGKARRSEIEKENAILKKELRDAQLERDILKKAVSIFSKSDGKYSNS